jgi:hypothetical protein
VGDAFGLLAIGAGGENNLKIGHVFTNYASCAKVLPPRLGSLRR